MVSIAFVLLTSFAAVGQADDIKEAYDRDFLVKGFPVCHAQRLYAQNAEKIASQQAVKDFAKGVRSDHDDIHKAFAKAAEDRKIAVVAGLEKTTKDNLAELNRLKGADYDRKYLRLTVDGHSRLIEIFDAQVKTGQNPELKEMAAQSLTKLRAHQSAAKQLLEQTK